MCSVTTTITNFQALFTTAQTFVVPAGVFSLDTYIVGTSGGGTRTVGHPPGNGPLMTGLLAVTPGETLHIQVGKFAGGTGTGGVSGSTGQAGWPDGGTGGMGPSFNKAGGGGGSSRIWRGGVGGTLLVCVAGAGGNPFSLAENSPNPGIGSGQAPPGEATINGPVQAHGHPLPTRGGGGATISAGGVAGIGTVNGVAGSFMQGGNGAAGTGITGSLVGSGGGGGGGYYGGGGGGTASGGGGGGMSYIDLSEGWTSTLWDLLQITQVPLGVSARTGLVRFTYEVPSPGGWSLGLRKQMG